MKNVHCQYSNVIIQQKQKKNSTEYSWAICQLYHNQVSGFSSKCGVVKSLTQWNF